MWYELCCIGTEDKMMTPLNIFYQEPDPDRWIKYDRYPRKVIRRIVRGKSKPGGMMMFALQLLQGLNKTAHPYRFNNFKYAANHICEPVCIVGKPQVLLSKNWKNPIIFGPATYSHPLDCPDLFARYPTVKKVIVPCNWMYQMFLPYYGAENLIIWPVGIDTERWNPLLKETKTTYDFLIYDKIRWEHNHYEKVLISPLIVELKAQNFTYDVIKYGHYDHDILSEKLSKCKAVIFLCEHETQGLAYQQILSTGTPILAWDKGGMWKDPAFYPHYIQFEEVSSVPYWDNRCGMKFKDLNTFKEQLFPFIKNLNNGIFAPRDYITENLELGKQALKFAEIAQSVKDKL
ncbi:hypothetical protein [Mucilaginibacter aquaedulcis]|uniref:hypothetical protein n=1 Tax=Mucilaginibacter aquaedulcis TaxID=1187081 RepID=UPI0025B3AF77|nr:hypothetical protein [Mucilaginibacter aquaedulcis]MDN3548741.1 hypothetical protein [Mucilaginibacter aquaedulcis]